MLSRWPSVVVCFTLLSGCGGSGDADERPEASRQAEPRESVFDPLTETLERAEGVEDTLREQSEELRRRVEEAEGE